MSKSIKESLRIEIPLNLLCAEEGGVRMVGGPIKAVRNRVYLKAAADDK